MLGCLARLWGALASTGFLRVSPQSPRVIAKREGGTAGIFGNSTVPTLLWGCKDSIHHAQVPAGFSYIAEEDVSLGKLSEQRRRWVYSRAALKKGKMVSISAVGSVRGVSERGLREFPGFAWKGGEIPVLSGLSSARCTCRPLALCASHRLQGYYSRAAHKQPEDRLFLLLSLCLRGKHTASLIQEYP